jgi:hypothetical protein
MDRILRAFVGFFRAIANVPEALAAFRTGYVKGASDVRREKGAVFPPPPRLRSNGRSSLQA